MINSIGRKKAIAERIALARTQAGLSQNQVGKILKLHRPSISEIEAGRRNVSAEELIKFAEIFKVDISWLACENSKEIDSKRDKIELAARELSKLKKDDLTKILDLLAAIKG